MTIPERWVLLYTAGLPSSVREERAAEIRSDVYEQLAAAAELDTARLARHLALAGRTARGVVDDLAWRREVGRDMEHSNGTTSARTVLTQTWWAPAAAAVAACDAGFAAWVLGDPQGTMPGRVVGPVLMLLAAAGLLMGLVRRSGEASTASRPTPARAALVALTAAAAIAALVVGGPAFLALGIVLLLVVAVAVLRGASGGAGADALIVMGTLPSLLFFWFVVPALLAVTVLIGLVTSPRRQVAPA